jgi:23S rRNA U2552 (ribose-2'-O)-methylase RlmE/FtsJ
MSILFLLPKSQHNIYKFLSLTEYSYTPYPIISNSLSFYLCDIKECINIYSKEWDIYKKYTNPYEFIHSVIPSKKKCISKYKPLSRSYFKMIEIFDYFFLDTYVCNAGNAPIRTFHLAEGPGGFLEAIIKRRSNTNDTYIGMTLMDDDNQNINVPGWKKSISFLNEYPNVIIEGGADNTGNILNLDNYLYCKEKYGSSIDFITADGGFDFSVDFNNQEMNITKLLFAQIAFALIMQKKGGHFILKIFDCFMYQTIDLVYLLTSFYKKVYIYKPNTSRLANSEKYIVCKGFIYDNSNEFSNYIYNTFYNMIQMNNSSKNIHRFLNVDVPNYFINKIEEYNSIFGQQQIENIYNTISLIEMKQKCEKVEQLTRTNVHKCIQWCIKHGISYHNISMSQTNGTSVSNGSGIFGTALNYNRFLQVKDAKYIQDDKEAILNDELDNK